MSSGPRRAPHGGILRCGRKADIHLLDELEQDIGRPCGRTLQEPLAGGAVLQVAEAAPENQEVLGDVGERREDSDPCRHNHLLPRRDCPPRHEIEPLPVRNSPNSGNFADRQDPTSGTSDCKRVRKTGKCRGKHSRPFQRPVFMLNF